MKNKINYLFFCLLLNFFVSFELSGKCVTVWIHGTHPAQRLLASKISPLRSKVYTQKGLSLAKWLPAHYNFNRIAQECCKKNPEKYDLDNFYIYGWNSAKLSSRHRKLVGGELSDEIKNLLKSQDVDTLRLIGFSHGGNVALNCLKGLPFNDKNMKVEVILIGTPIQESNKENINNALISKAYSLYSTGDWIQRIDMQKLHSTAPKHSPWLSKRVFDSSSNVVQVCMTRRGKSIGHIEYRSLLPHVSEIIQKVDEQLEQNPNQKNISLDVKF